MEGFNKAPQPQNNKESLREQYLTKRKEILEERKIDWFEYGTKAADNLKIPKTPKTENQTEKNEKQRKQNEIFRKARETVERDVLPVIKDKYPELTDKQIHEHPMIGGEIVPVIVSGYEVRKPYILYENETGFTLKSEPMRYGQEPLPEYRFNYSDFEASLKKPAEKIVEEDYDLEIAVKKQEAYEINFPNLGEENSDNAKSFTDGTITSEEFEEITYSKLDQIAAKNNKLTKFKNKVKDLIGESMKMFRNGESISNINEMIEKSPVVAQYIKYENDAETKKDYKTLASLKAYQKTFKALLKSHGIDQ